MEIVSQSRSLSVGKRSFGLKNVANVPFQKLNKALKINRRKKEIGLSISSPKIVKQSPTEESDSSFIDSSKILGSNNEFVNYSEVVDSYNVADEISKSSIKISNSLTGFTKNRTFDSVLTKLKDVPEEETAMLPNQLKAVISGEDDSTRTNYSTPEGDLLADPETKNFFELNNFSVQELSYVDGFQADQYGNIMMDKPVYKIMNINNFSSVTKPVVCFMKNYTNNNFNITDEDTVSVIDSSFIMSDVDVTVKQEQTVPTETPNYSIQEINYEFMSSNIVVQTNQKLNVQIEQRAENNVTTPMQTITLPIIMTDTFGTY